MAASYSPQSDPIYGNLQLGDHIPETRFFKLETGRWQDPIRCELIKEALTTRPEYDAISYAWGETAGGPGSSTTNEPRPSTEAIIINGHEFEVSRNLAAALRVFRKTHVGKLLWADAISHNQRDRPEMNRQVGRMREIYQQCQVVRIWLGDESRLLHPDTKLSSQHSEISWTSGSAVETDSTPAELEYNETEKDRERLKNYKARYLEFYNLPTALQHDLTQDFRLGSFCFLHSLARGDHLNHQDLQFLEHLSSRDGIFEALDEMMSRMWWNRQWVIQETVLATNAIVHYGSHTIPWNMLRWAATNVQTHRVATCCSPEYAKLRTSDLKVIDKFTEVVRDIDTWRSIWLSEDSARTRLLPLLWQFRQRKTGRLPDKAYALLPLVRDWGDEKEIQVRYDWEVDHIYADLIRHLIYVENSLLPLMGTVRKSGQLSSLPSWVPDWTVAPDAYELARLDRTLNYHACGVKVNNGRTRLKFDTKTNIRFYETDCGSRFKFLALRGNVFDKVSKVGQEMPQNNHGAIRETFAAWCRLASPLEERYVGGQITKREAYYRTLCMDTEYIGKENDDDNLPMYRKDYQRTLADYASNIEDMRRTATHDVSEMSAEGIGRLNSKKRKVTFKDNSFAEHSRGHASQRLRNDFEPPSRSGTARSLDGPDDIVKINTSIKTATTGRRFFLTDSGYMGLGPKELQKGDEVAVLIGGHTPFVLRKTDEKAINQDIGTKICRSLVGDCYIHGVMDGKIFTHVNKIVQLETLYLE